MNSRIASFLGVALSLVLSSCGGTQSPAYHAPPNAQKGQPPEVAVRPVLGEATATDKEHTAQDERDQIYSLVAYAVVLKDWQSPGELNCDKQFRDSLKPGGPPLDRNCRGYNIGSVLVKPNAKDRSRELVCWARNAVRATYNGTQHGEVRLITSYLRNNTEEKKLKDHRLYTTLEPCAMCSGMMVLQELPSTIYGQTDPGFGKALERLSLNSAGAKIDGIAIDGHEPYPRPVLSVAANLEIRRRIDAAFARWMKETGKDNITEWLAGDEAKALFGEAHAQLLAFKPKFEENTHALEGALKLVALVPNNYNESAEQAVCPIRY